MSNFRERNGDVFAESIKQKEKDFSFFDACRGLRVTPACVKLPFPDTIAQRSGKRSALFHVMPLQCHDGGSLAMNRWTREVRDGNFAHPVVW